ncbi:MAG: Fur family transcriptional regulator [Deinococcota bacterium]
MPSSKSTHVSEPTRVLEHTESASNNSENIAVSDDVMSMRSLLKEHNLRYSKPRELILAFFQEQDRHVNAEAVYVALKQRGHSMSLSTIYLNLNALSEAGLIREFPSPTGETIYDSNVHEHYHLICTETGESFDIPVIVVDGKPITQLIKEQVETLTGWQIQEPELVLRGSPQQDSPQQGSPQQGSPQQVKQHHIGKPSSD